MGMHLNSLYERWGRRPDWMSAAACMGEPLEIFYPDTESDADLAKAICEVCPVRIDCLDYALANFRGATDSGVWGGTTERERAAIRRRIAKAKALEKAATPVTIVT